jgi:hypothetical protein
MKQYYVLTLDPRARLVHQFIHTHKLDCEVHLNRTRFWVPEGPVLTEFLLRFSESCPLVDSSLDLTTGR